jgi:hypothetical protein
MINTFIISKYVAYLNSLTYLCSMLKDLERHFSQMGWYSGTHTFIDFRLEGGFEAFSGKASETWEYRWVVTVLGNQELQIPAIIVKGKYHESLDDVCDRTLKELLKKEKVKTPKD